MQFFISFLSGIVLFYSFQYFPFSALFILLLTFVYLFVKKKFFFIAIILLGIAFAFVRYEPPKDMSHVSGREVEVKGVFSSLPIKTESGRFKQSFEIESAMEVNAGERLNELAGREIVVFSDRELEPRREYEIVVKFLKDRTRLNPGRWDRDKLYTSLLEVEDLGHKRISLNSKIQEYRYRVNRYIGENFKRDSGAFIAAITTGQRANIDEELRDAFNSTGLAHILSISGTHFGLFSVFLFGIFRFLINAFPYRILQRITIFLTPSQAAAILCLPFMLAYLGLSGGSVPAVRSFIMIGLFLLGLLIGRKGFWLNSLLFAAFVLTVWEPEVILSLSFQLSFLAVLFIGFSIRNREDDRSVRQAHDEDRKVLRYIKNAVLLTLSASIGTAPLVAYYFHYFSIISPISNLFIAPLIGFILIPLSVVSSFLFLITGHYVFTPIVSAVSDVSISSVRLLADIPFADIKIPAFPPIIILLFYAGFIFYFLSRRKRYTLLIPFVPVLIYFSLTIFEKKDLTITFLDVGQGDSSVVELPDGKTLVIDTGRSGRETASFLKYKGREAIDAVILSHVHIDHTGGLDYILKRFRVRELWDNGRLIYPDTYLSGPSARLRTGIKHRTLNRGDIIEGKGYSIYVFHPYPEFYTMYGSDNVEANNDSLVLKIKGRNNSFLFTGDIEEEAEEDTVHLGGWLKSDVIKVPHQGGKTSAYEPFLDAVSPQIAVISVGRDNPFGHPHKEMLDALQGVRIFRTDLDGAVKIKESAKRLEIKTYKDFQFEKANSFREEMRNIKRLFETW
ncbi:MAG: DNA internalization-related competence protein ComEC/Rec2 [Thermodesulfovibrionales bacterium]|nr:DNA internalization-related competence protein ComEC/Rec2 [Thermodesulfovibrionales bacterium]